MTIDLAFHLDIKSFYERYSNITGKATNSRNDGKEWHGSCPRCGGTDRFSFWESGRFSCSLRASGCGWHGSSPYWFLRDEGHDHQRACDELGIDPTEMFEQRAVKLPLFLTRDEPPCQKWQDAAEAFCQRAQRYLWSPGGKEALDLLHSKGLRNEIIQRAQLGYCPGWYNEALATWGLCSEQTEKNQDTIKIPQGIIIPWRVNGNIWKISVRRGPSNYFQVLGSSDALYNVDAIQTCQPVLLTESELDALSAEQEAGDLVAAVATGSSAKALTGRWIGRLLQASHILQGFDDDAAGEAGAAEWLRILPEGRACRWRPWAHDISDMLKENLPVKLWVEAGLRIANIGLPPAPEQPAKAPPEPLARVEVYQEAPQSQVASVTYTRICPHCAACGRISAGGVELVARGPTRWLDTYRKIPGKSYEYVWIESQKCWMCTGCYDQRKILPILKM